MAQFVHVGAEVGVASFVIRFAQYSIVGLPKKQAATYLKLHLIGFMIGRFTGSAVLKRIPAPGLLSFFGLAAFGLLFRDFVGHRSGSGRDAGVVWVLSLHVLPDDLCAKNQPRVVYEAWFTCW